MLAGWMVDARAMRAVRQGVTRFAAAAGLIGVGLVANAAPADAVVLCDYNADTATLTLQKRDGLTIGHANGNFVVTDRLDNSVTCDPDATMETVKSVKIGVDPLDNDDDEQVTIDLANGPFVNSPGTVDEHDIAFSIDLGARGVDSLVIEGANDSVNGDHITVAGTSVELNGNSQPDVTTTDVERVEIRGNDGNDIIDAQTSTFGISQPTVLSGSTTSPGVTLVGGDGDDDLTGGDGADMLIGNGGDDMLTGMAGNDWLDTGSGPGTRTDLMLDGGLGIDTADFSGMFVPVEANLGDGGAAYGEGGSALSEVENVVGTEFADLLVGDNGDNVIEAAGGDDEAYGMGGKDRIRGNNGDDLLNGTGGGDSLEGGDGDDTLHGGGGSDSVGGGSGGDTIHGGGSGSGSDVINSETGSDVIYGGNGRQVIFAGDGDDEVYGEEGNDLVDGQDGEDHVFGGQGNDTSRGGDGPDAVYGGFGSNHVDGGAGDDEVYAGGGGSVDGGAGDDAVFGGSSSDQLTGDIGDDVLSGGGGSDRLTGSDGDDILNAGDGSDHLNGSDGDDVLNAGDGSDLLQGQHGDDVLRGAGGTDTVSFEDSRFGVTASLADGAASGEGEDALTDIENLWGSHFADSLTGDHFRNQLRGRAGADVLAGGLGSDQESGDGGNDVLDQGRRSNGGDKLSGGAGRRDVVDYSARSHRVRVTRNGKANDGERGEHDNVGRDINRVRR